MSDQSPKRPNFFAGKLLSAEDLALEQNYFLNKSKRHNRFLHGFGIVSGLHVDLSSGKIAVDPGLALDCEGNEIVLPVKQVLAVALIPDTARYLNIGFEEKMDFVPGPGGEEQQQPAIINDSFALAFSAQNYNSNHRHSHGRWLVCGNLHPLTIAKLLRTSSGWHIDRRYRQPRVKA